LELSIKVVHLLYRFKNKQALGSCNAAIRPITRFYFLPDDENHDRADY
jgi:hypothetical protein